MGRRRRPTIARLSFRPGMHSRVGGGAVSAGCERRSESRLRVELRGRPVQLVRRSRYCGDPRVRHGEPASAVDGQHRCDGCSKHGDRDGQQLRSGRAGARTLLGVVLVSNDRYAHPRPRSDRVLVCEQQLHRAFLFAGQSQCFFDDQRWGLARGVWHPYESFPGAVAAVRAVFRLRLQPKHHSATVNFDDVAFETTPLAVSVHGLRATRSHRGVTLRWRTGTEADTLGFNVYRQTGARRVLVNRRLIPALGGVAGSAYSYRDRSAPQHRVLRYWLQDVAIDGTRTWHASVRVSGA